MSVVKWNKLILKNFLQTQQNPTNLTKNSKKKLAIDQLHLSDKGQKGTSRDKIVTSRYKTGIVDPKKGQKGQNWENQVHTRERNAQSMENKSQCLAITTVWAPILNIGGSVFNRGYPV